MIDKSGEKQKKQSCEESDGSGIMEIVMTSAGSSGPVLTAMPQAPARVPRRRRPNDRVAELKHKP
jgi:microcompartment protein CcmK/EutM